MRKLEVKNVSPASAFKVTVYFLIVPMILVFLLGVLFTIIGIASGTQEFTILGITYSIMPIFSIALYGLFSMLSSLIYNWLAKKFGGLVITVEDKDNAPSQYQQSYQPTHGQPNQQNPYSQS